MPQEGEEVQRWQEEDQPYLLADSWNVQVEVLTQIYQVPTAEPCTVTKNRFQEDISVIYTDDKILLIRKTLSPFSHYQNANFLCK